MKVRLLTGFDYLANGVGPNVRHEAGEIVDDFPPKELKDWVANGAIEIVDEPEPVAVPRNGRTKDSA